MTRIVIRADSSYEMGAGHLVRCLTLGRELARRGASVILVSRAHAGNALAVVTDLPLLVLPAPAGDAFGSQGSLTHGHLLGVSQVQDWDETSVELARAGWTGADWVIVDHYGIGHDWEHRAHGFATRVLAIDDLADRSHAADTLLDQNFFPDGPSRYADLLPMETEFLCGPEFALLRPEFRALRDHMSPRKFSGKPLRLLVFFGGSDPAGTTLRAIEAIASGPKLAMGDVVVGNANAQQKQIARHCRDLGWAFHVQTDRIHELMAGADLAVSAAGSSIWERACLGLPSLVVTNAANQQQIARSAQEAGLICWLGHADQFVPADFLSKLTALLGDSSTLEAMSKSGLALVDGRGAERVADRILLPRPVTHT